MEAKRLRGVKLGHPEAQAAEPKTGGSKPQSLNVGA